MAYLRFREDKTTQAAARLLRLKKGRIPYLSLIKLLYFADRRALAALGHPISSDLFVSMPHGPVLSRTYDLIVGETDPEPTYWRQHISEPENYEVFLTQDPGNDSLSPAEESVLDLVFREFGHLSKWSLKDRAHELPEYEDPHGSSIPIRLRDILKAQGISEDDATSLLDDLRAADYTAEQLTE